MNTKTDRHPKLKYYGDRKLAELRRRVEAMKHAPKKWRDEKLAQIDAEIKSRGEFYLP